MIQETVFTFSPEMLVALLKGQEIRIEQTPGTWMIFRIEQNFHRGVFYFPHSDGSACTDRAVFEPEMDLDSVFTWVKEK